MMRTASHATSTAARMTIRMRLNINAAVHSLSALTMRRAFPAAFDLCCCARAFSAASRDGRSSVAVQHATASTNANQLNFTRTDQRSRPDANSGGGSKRDRAVRSEGGRGDRPKISAEEQQMRIVETRFQQLREDRTRVSKAHSAWVGRKATTTNVHGKPDFQKAAKEVQSALSPILTLLQEQPQLQASHIDYLKWLMDARDFQLHSLAHPFFERFQSQHEQQWQAAAMKRATNPEAKDPDRVPSRLIGVIVDSIAQSSPIGVEKAQAALDWMRQPACSEQFEWDANCFNPVLQAMTQVRPLNMQAVCDWFQRMPVKNAVSFSILVKFYSDAERIDDAVATLRQLLESKLTLDPTVIGTALDLAYQVFMSAAADPQRQADMLQMSEGFWLRAKDDPATLMDAGVTGAMLKILAAAKSIGRMLALFDEALKLEQQENKVHEEARMGDAEGHAESQQRKSKETPVAVFVNAQCFTLVFTAFSASPDPSRWSEDALRLWTLAVQRAANSKKETDKFKKGELERWQDLQLTDSSVNAHLKYLQQSNQNEQVERLWSGIADSMKENNPRIFVAMLNHCAFVQNSALAERIIAEFDRIRVPWNAHVFSAWLGCYSNSGDVAASDRIWQCMTKASVQPTSISYEMRMKALIVCVSRNPALFSRIDALLEEMRTAGPNRQAIRFDGRNYSELIHRSHSVNQSDLVQRWAAMAEKVGLVKQLDDKASNIVNRLTKQRSSARAQDASVAPAAATAATGPRKKEAWSGGSISGVRTASQQTTRRSFSSTPHSDDGSAAAQRDFLAKLKSLPLEEARVMFQSTPAKDKSCYTLMIQLDLAAKQVDEAIATLQAMQAELKLGPNDVKADVKAIERVIPRQAALVKELSPQKQIARLLASLANTRTSADIPTILSSLLALLQRSPDLKLSYDQWCQLLTTASDAQQHALVLSLSAHLKAEIEDELRARSQLRRGQVPRALTDAIFSALVRSSAVDGLERAEAELSWMRHPSRAVHFDVKRVMPGGDLATLEALSGQQPLDVDKLRARFDAMPKRGPRHHAIMMMAYIRTWRLGEANKLLDAMEADLNRTFDASAVESILKGVRQTLPTMTEEDRPAAIAIADGVWALALRYPQLLSVAASEAKFDWMRSIAISSGDPSKLFAKQLQLMMTMMELELTHADKTNAAGTSSGFQPIVSDHRIVQLFCQVSAIESREVRLRLAPSMLNLARSALLRVEAIEQDALRTGAGTTAVGRSSDNLLHAMLQCMRATEALTKFWSKQLHIAKDYPRFFLAAMRECAEAQDLALADRMMTDFTRFGWPQATTDEQRRQVRSLIETWPAKDSTELKQVDSCLQRLQIADTIGAASQTALTNGLQKFADFFRGIL